MAIQVNGTTVIDNSRSLTNIASVDAATATAIGNAGVGGSGTINATTAADAGVTKGNPVGFDKQGKVRALLPLTDISNIDQSVYRSNNNYGGDTFSFDFDSTGTKVIGSWYISGGGSYVQYWAIAGTINSNNTITWGSPVQFDTGAGNINVKNPVVWCNNNSWVTRYMFYNGSERRVRVRALQWGSGNTVTYGSSYEADYTYHNDSEDFGTISRTNNGGFLFSSSPAGTARIYAGTVSGTSISLGSGVTVASTGYIPTLDINPNTGKFVAYGYNDGSNCNFTVGTVSGNTISYTNSTVSVTGGLSIPSGCGIGWLSDTVFQCSRSTFSINSSNQVSFKTQFDGSGYPLVTANNGVTNPDTGELYRIYRSDGIPVLNIYTHDLVNNTVSESGESIIQSTFFDGHPVPANYFYEYQGDTILYDGKPYQAFCGVANYRSYFAIIGADTEKSVGSSIFGVAQENIAANTTGKIAVAGGEVTGLSGFTAGKRYSYSTATGEFELGGTPFVVASSSSSIVVL